MGKQTEEAKLRGNGMHRPVESEGGVSDKPTHDLKPLDEEKLNSPELLSGVEDRLANLRDITAPARGKRGNPAADDEPETPDEPEDKTADDDADVRTDDSEDSDTSTLDGDDKAVSKDDKDGSDETKEHVLPEAYERAAIAYGWTKDSVRSFFTSDPERALSTLSNIYLTRNKASAEFAAIGRRAAQSRDQPEAKPAFKPVDTGKLREQYGDDAAPLIEMIEAQNKTLQQLAEQMPTAKSKEKNESFRSAVEESGVEQQVYNFFESDRMKPYARVYGKLDLGMVWDDLPAGQAQHRWKVLEKADQIAGGAKLQGIDMTLDEAMEAAHLLVTQPYRDQILIDGIKEKAVKRSNGITLKPKGTRKSGDSVDAGKPGTRTREQLLEATQQRLSKMYS